MKFIKAIALPLLFFCSWAMAQTYLLSGATATGAGAWFVPQDRSAPKMFQGTAISTAGTGTAVMTVGCSLDGVNSMPLGTITLVTGTTTFSTDGFGTALPCRALRGTLTTVTGTGTTANLSVFP